METKEIKINPPEGYEIDKENSTFDCIRFKPVAKRWRDNINNIKGYYITEHSRIVNAVCTSISSNDNVFASKKQAKSALAMARISQIMANDKRFGGVVTDEEWGCDASLKYTIERRDNKIETCIYCNSYHFLAFHTQEQRDLFLEENEDLVKDYLMIQ